MKKKFTQYKEEEIQSLAQQRKRTQVQKRYYEDPLDLHKQEYGINFQNKLYCDSRH
jgi:predicted naringenin-chalcone synthase